MELNEGSRDFKVKVIDSDDGWLFYYYDNTGKTWTIEEVYSSNPGGGKKLVARLVEMIGKNQEVKAEAVIEEETRNRLREVGITNFVEKSKKKITITSPAVLKTLKVVRMLTGGGINVGKMVIEPVDTHDDPEDWKDIGAITVDLYGRT